MFVTGLTLANFRVIQEAEFDFHPGMNLIVGVNGVGKTSVLDALAVCLSAVVKEVNKLRTRVIAFDSDDIRIGADSLTAKCRFRLHQEELGYLVHKPRQAVVPREGKAGMPREQVRSTPGHTEFFSVGREKPAVLLVSMNETRPLAVLFSPNRAVPSLLLPSSNAAAGGIVGATADALTSRELRLGEIAAWMKTREELSREQPAEGRILATCEDVVRRFLPGYRNLRQDGTVPPQLWIDRDAMSIPVRRLSDGERGSLALVLDLTRRLALANPNVDDPASEGEAVVLIDEIDLHLHPKWQRQIVHNLTAAFPRCQFIATTHSPQIVGEVPHERIQIVADGEVYSPSHSFGVDSSRVLEEIMEADPRTERVHELLGEISRVVGRERFKRGRELLTELIEILGENDPEVTRIRTLLDFLEGEE